MVNLDDSICNKNVSTTSGIGKERRRIEGVRLKLNGIHAKNMGSTSRREEHGAI